MNIQTHSLEDGSITKSDIQNKNEVSDKEGESKKEMLERLNKRKRLFQSNIYLYTSKFTRILQ